MSDLMMDESDHDGSLKDDGYTVEIFFENDENTPRKKTHPKKKQKNEHRKTKKRKHIEQVYEFDSSCDNISNLKTKQKNQSHKKQKKTKKEKKKSSKSKNKASAVTELSNIFIKQEAITDNEMEESDEDVPLSLLERDDKGADIQLKCSKMYEILNTGDMSETEGKVKKLKIKKVKKQKDTNTICEMCNKTFDTILKFKAHMRKVHGQKPFVCIICSKAFNKEKDLLNHHNIHTGLNPYCCGECGKLFKSDSTLKKHMKIFHVTESKKFACSICSKILSSASCLEEHERLHTGENPWSCNLCGKLFARERDLKLHANLHEEAFKCDVCQRCFITSFKLKEHYRSHTGETPYECDKCDRKFARLADYRYHVGTHLGLKPFSCELCGIKFTTSSSMKRHLINMHHQGPLDFKCNMCNKAFHTQARLNSHIKNHENKQKFCCHICNATRSSHSELQRHLILHSGEFRCDTCNKNCSSAERLAAHVAKHDLTGKPYACFVCSLGYLSSQTLNKHLATVHKNEDIPKVTPQHLCTLCGMVFDHKDKLNRHLKDDHIVLAVGEIHSLIDDVQLYKRKREVSVSSQRIINKVEKSNVDPSSVQPSFLGEEKEKECIDSPAVSQTDKVISKQSNLLDVKDNKDDLIQNCGKNKVIQDLQHNNDQNKSTFLENKKLDKLHNTVEETKFPLNDGLTTQSITNTLHASIKTEKIPTKYDDPLEDPRKSNIVVEKIHSATELIEDFSRKNIEDYLQKQTPCNSLPTEQFNSIQPSKPDTSKCGSDRSKIVIPNYHDVIEKQNAGSVMESINSSLEKNKKKSNVSSPSEVQNTVIESHLSKLLSNNLIPPLKQEVSNKKESDNYTNVFNEKKPTSTGSSKRLYMGPEQSNTIANEAMLANMSNTNYFSDVGVRDLSISSADYKHKSQCKSDLYDNLYSKLPYNDSVYQHSKHSSQSSYKNTSNIFENYNHIQPSLHQTPNPWFLPNKIPYINPEESSLKQNSSRTYTDTKPKESKVNRTELFDMELSDFGDYSHRKSHVEPKHDMPSSTLHKDNFYDKKHSYNSAGITDHKNYFDNLNQKQYLEDNRKRLSNTQSTGIDTTNSKQNSRHYQSLHLSSELPTSLSLRDTGDQLNYYNPHAFASMANSPHLFQNFRELQERMLSSGLPGYNQHTRQHFFSGMDMSSQRTNNSSVSSMYHQTQSHLNNMSSHPRNAYSDLMNPDGSLLSYQLSKPTATSTEDTQGKEDDSGPFELRVAAN